MTTQQLTPCRDRYQAASDALAALDADATVGGDDPRYQAALDEVEAARDAYRASDEPRTWTFGGDGGAGAPDQVCRRPDLQALAEDGDWGEMDPAAGSLAVKVSAECEDTGEELSELCVIDPEEPECPLGEHEWSDDHDLVGGCESNPGVQGHGAGISVSEVCVLCGMERISYTCTQGEHAETEHDHDGVRYEADSVDADGLARHHDGVPPAEALETYDGAGQDLVDACLAYQMEHGDRETVLGEMIEDEQLPVAAVASIIRGLGRACIESDDDSPESMDDSDARWVTSTHTLTAGGLQIATWTRCSRGGWGGSGARPDAWTVVEDTNGGDRLSERLEAILDELGLTDECPAVPEPDTTVEEDPAGEWCVYWDTVGDDEHVVARYATEEDATRARDAKDRELRGANPGDLLCGYSVRHLVDSEWLAVGDEE